MSNLEVELSSLKQNVSEMFGLVIVQLEKCKKAILENNHKLVKDIFTSEDRINFLELTINEQCEDILALFSPVATDLRLVMASLNIGSDLERIGDNEKRLAKSVFDVKDGIPKKYLKKFKVEEMFDVSISMLTETNTLLFQHDTQSIRKIFKKDSRLNEINKEALKSCLSLIKSHPEDAKTALHLFSSIKRLERIGDLTRNIGEELIFYEDAKIMRHKKLQAK